MCPHSAARPEAAVRTFSAAISADDRSVARAKSTANDNPTGLMSLFRLSGRPRRWFQLLCLIGPPLRYNLETRAVLRPLFTERPTGGVTEPTGESGTCQSNTVRAPTHWSPISRSIRNTCVGAPAFTSVRSSAPQPSGTVFWSSTVHSPVVPCSVVPCSEWPSCSQFLFSFVVLTAVSWLFPGLKLFNCFQPHFHYFWFVI